MKYNGLTSVGSIYQAKCAANNIPVKFVKVKVGDGLLEETENPLNFTDIKSLKKEVGISEIAQVNEAVRLTVPLDNDGVTEGYYPREFGIYVEDDGVEVLYWYINDGQEASYLPPQSSAPVKIKNHFNIIATSLESLIVNWDGKEFWVDKEYLGKELAKKEDKIEIKESAFNRPFGTLEGEVLEGHRLAQSLGLEFGGELNNNNLKQAGKAYYDTLNKSIYKCLVDNTTDYADTSKFEAISNDDLLLKLQNLTNKFVVLQGVINGSTIAFTSPYSPRNSVIIGIKCETKPNNYSYDIQVTEANWDGRIYNIETKLTNIANAQMLLYINYDLT